MHVGTCCTWYEIMWPSFRERGGGVAIKKLLMVCWTLIWRIYKVLQKLTWMLFLGKSAAKCTDASVFVCLCVYSMTDWIQTHVCQFPHNETEKLCYTVVPSACLGSAATIFRIPYLQVGNCSPAQDFIFLLWVFKPNIRPKTVMLHQLQE